MFHIMRLLLTAVAVSMLAANAQAKCKTDVDHRWYITSGVSYIFGDNDRLADNDIGFNLGLGKALSKCWNFELNGVYDKLDFNAGGGEYSQLGLTADALMFFSGKREFSPYVLAGAGFMRTRSLGVADVNPLLNVGLGVMSTFTDSGIGARLEGRYRVDYDDRTIPSQEHFRDWQIGLSLVVPLGHKKKMMAAAPVVVKEMMPADDDKDGVINSKDQCLNSPHGARVDMKGCEIKDIISLKGVTFATSSARLTGISTTILDGAAATLNKHKMMNVQVAGHTDNTGSVSYNRSLSQRRAESVRTYLISKGIAADRLTARGYGPDEPVASNNLDTGRAENRRVELRIQK